MTDDTKAFVGEALRPCPACPDGNFWTVNGPVGICDVCKGHAMLNFDGSPLRPEQTKEIT